MSPWLVAALVGLAFGFLQYGGRGLRVPARALPLALARVVSVGLLTALLLDAAVGLSRPQPPLAALDASASWLRGNDSSAWRRALAAVREAHPDSVFLFGDSLRPQRDGNASPRDLTSLVRPAVDRALGSGRPLVVVTDGELDDGDALRALPGGSRVVVVPRTAHRDLALRSLEAPRAAVSGDTVALRVGLAAGALGAAPGALTLDLGGRAVARVSIDSMAPYAERAVDIRAPLAGPEGPAVLRAIVSSPGDVEPRNDTLASGVDLSRAASAVFVSTSPDFDVRYALAVLRGAVALPARGYLRVAPGAWRVEGSLTPVTETEVRRAFAEAPIAVLHGDTAAFGPPRAATRAPLALIVPPAADDGEWYAVAAPPSPLSAALGGLPWDSLPPIAVAATAPRGEWQGLEARRGRADDRRIAIAGSDTPRRVVVIAASGFWRWRFRGGPPADAFAALWGSIFDWLAAERADRRAAVPEPPSIRAGEPVRWRRGAAADTSVVAVLRRRGAPARVDSVRLRFAAGASIVETPGLPTGIYDVSVPGGAAVLAVNASRELLPRAPRVASGSVGRGSRVDNAPRLRSTGWPYAVVLVLLCVEWVVRRRMGMR